MRVVLASRNDGKLQEMRRLLNPLQLQLESQSAHNVPSPAETGTTFIENALIKARTVSRATSLPTIADDSGLVVSSLQGAPGIFSARYSGANATDQSNNLKLVEELQAFTDRTAYFYCAIVYLRHSDDPTPIIATGLWRGSIVDEPRGSHGFGYDPHFLVDGTQLTSAQLQPTHKSQLSHRGQACRSLITQLEVDVG